MSVYEKYIVEVNLIPGLPQIPFETANKKAAGVVMHSTANYAGGDDTADGERNYENGHWQDAFVHTFTDDKKIEQCADYNYGAWHAYTYANHHFLGNELCQFEDTARFANSYDRWVWVAARQLFDLGLKPEDKVTIWSHKEISETYQGNHEDPISYLATHNKSWADVLTDVTNYYNLMVKEKQVIKPSQAPVTAPKPVVKQTAQPVKQTASPKPAKLVLPAAPTWTVYKMGHPANKSNTANIAGELLPAHFGGLTYDILGSTGPNVYIIKTQAFGEVQIYAAPSTGAKVIK